MSSHLPSSAIAEEEQQASTAAIGNAMAIAQQNSLMGVDIQASGIRAFYATSKTTSCGTKGFFSCSGCFSWLQPSSKPPGVGTQTSCRPLQLNQRSGPPAPSPESLRTNSLIAPERLSCATNSSSGGPEANISARGNGINGNAPPPLPLPLEVAPPPVSARPPLPPQVLAACPAGVDVIKHHSQAIVARHVASGHRKFASSSANVAEANDETKAIDEVGEDVMEINSATSGDHGHCSQAAAGEEEQEENDKDKNKAEQAEATVTSEDAATPKGLAIEMQNRILLNLMQDTPRTPVKSFEYKYFQQIRAQLRSAKGDSSAVATHIKHIAAIHWLHYVWTQRNEPYYIRSNPNPINPDGVLVATYVKMSEGRPCFDTNNKTMWRWPELIASIDDNTLLMHEGQPAYTPLQYIVNGPDGLQFPARNIGIAECKIHDGNCLYIKRRNGSSACLRMHWADGRIRANEFGSIDNSVFFDIVM
jgi:hypothetical protein